MASPVQILSLAVSPDSFQPDEHLVSLGYSQRLYLDPVTTSPLFSILGVAHIRHCLQRPHVAADLTARDLPSNLKELMSWIASRKIDYAGITNPEYLQYYLSSYVELEALFGQLTGMEDGLTRLSDLLKVHIVLVLHQDQGVKVQIYCTEGVAPILHLEVVSEVYYVLVPSSSEGMPLEGSKTAIEQYYSLYLPRSLPRPPPVSEQNSQWQAPDQGNPPRPVTPPVQPNPPSPTQPSQPDSAPSPALLTTDPSWQSALDLIDIQKKIIQSLLLANVSLQFGAETMSLLAKAQHLAGTLQMGGTEYQSIRTQLEQRIAQAPDQAAAPSAELNSSGQSPSSTTQKTVPNPSTSSVSARGVSPAPAKPNSTGPVPTNAPPKTSANSASISRPTQPAACRICPETEASMIYVDGNHPLCRVCYNCAVKMPKCPKCNREYTPGEIARFKLITSP